MSEARRLLERIRERAEQHRLGQTIVESADFQLNEIESEARAYLAQPVTKCEEREGELVEKARAYLKRGLHLMGCNGFPHTKEPCDCGFQALKDALAALGEKA